MLHRTSRRGVRPLLILLLAVALLAISVPAHAIGVVCPGCARGESQLTRDSFSTVGFE